MDEPQKLLVLKNIYKSFGSGKKRVSAVINVDFSMNQGETVAVVGESGSGKTTLAHIILGLLSADQGEVYYMGEKLDLKTTKEHRAYWREVQSIFQDPFACFNIFYTVEILLNNCLEFLQIKKNTSLAQQLKQEACHYVNLDYDELKEKRAFELSGGQMQRMMIARIFLLKPRLLIADEPTSMIDACSRMQILEMLKKLSRDTGMSMVLITHDIGLAYYMSDTLYIMEKGSVIESGEAEVIMGAPKADYTINLLRDVPTLEGEWLC